MKNKIEHIEVKVEIKPKINLRLNRAIIPKIYYSNIKILAILLHHLMNRNKLNKNEYFVIFLIFFYFYIVQVIRKRKSNIVHLKGKKMGYPRSR